MSELIADIADGIDAGLFPSLPGRRGAIWRDGRNVTFMEESVQAALGQFGLFYTGTSSPITGIAASVISGADKIYFGTPADLFCWDGTTVDERTNSGGDYTGTTSDLWSFARWGNWMAASNGVDALQVDKNDTNDFNDLSGTPFTYAKVIAATDTHLLAANTSLGGSWLGWTDVDDIEDWTAAADNQAGAKELRNSDSDIKCMVGRGAGFALFTLNQMYGIEFIGTPFVFSVRRLLTGFGAVGKQAVATVGRRHFGFGRRGLWVTDGVSYEFFDGPKVNDFIYGDSPYRYNQDLGDLVVAWHDQLQHSVVFYYPTTGSTYNNIGISYNYKTGAFSLLDYGRTFVDDSGVYPFALTGDRVGNIYQQSATATAPTAGEQGFLKVESEEWTLEAGYGDLGYGELGYGGTLTQDNNGDTALNVNGIATIIRTTAGIQYPNIIFSSGNLYVESKDLDLGIPDKQKFIDRIEFDLEAPSDVQLFSVQIGYRDRLKDDVTWLDKTYVTLDNPYVTPRITAKFFTLKFTDELPLVQWKLSRMAFYGRVMKGRK